MTLIRSLALAAATLISAAAMGAPAGGAFRDYSCGDVRFTVTPSVPLGQRITVQWTAPNSTSFLFALVRVDIFEQGGGGSQFFPLSLDAVRQSDMTNPQYLAVTSLDGSGIGGAFPAPTMSKVSDAYALALDKAQYFTSDFPQGPGSFGLRVDRLRGDLVAVEMRYLCDYGGGVREYVQPFPVKVQ
jgi:hypothetical protein